MLARLAADHDLIPVNYQAMFGFADSIRSPRSHGAGGNVEEIEIGQAEALLIGNHVRTLLLTSDIDPDERASQAGGARLTTCPGLPNASSGSATRSSPPRFVYVEEVESGRGAAETMGGLLWGHPWGHRTPADRRKRERLQRCESRSGSGSRRQPQRPERTHNPSVAGSNPARPT
jgi:hypothetical protein